MNEPTGLEKLENFLADPLHVGAIRLCARLFGGFKSQSYCNVLPRGGYAFGVLRACELAKLFNISHISAVEFGVASGTGLEHLIRYAKEAEKITGVKITVLGFDNQTGLPPARSWLNHPEIWKEGEFKSNVDLIAKFRGRAIITIGDVEDTVTALRNHPRIGFAAIDVDFYTSTVPVLEAITEWSIPVASLYFDDIEFTTASEGRGELRAIAQFNEDHPEARISQDLTLPGNRLIRYARWYKHMYLHSRELADTKVGTECQKFESLGGSLAGPKAY